MNPLVTPVTSPTAGDAVVVTRHQVAAISLPFILAAVFTASALAGDSLLRYDPRYAPSESCRECHAAACDLWESSDHHRAWNDASPENVLGDFHNTTFFHIGFDDLPQLSREERLTLITALWDANPREMEYQPGVKRKPPQGAVFGDIALALRDAKSGVEPLLREVMSNEQSAALDTAKALLTQRQFVRAGEIAAAQHRISSMVRHLVAEKKISPPALCNVIIMSQRGNVFVVTIDGADGIQCQFDVRFVIGARPLQQYIVEQPGGRLQVLPVAWDSVDGVWFHLYPKEQINSDDPLHWTRPLQNATAMCADCHTTDWRPGFAVANQTYAPSCVEATVGCQSCHGPCGDHVTRAKERDLRVRWDHSDDLGTFRLSEATSRQSLDSCAMCHARRRLLTPPPRQVGDNFLDHAMFELLDGELYEPDGQLREECFEYGSFAQSKMFARDVRCTDCHDAHSARLRLPRNRLCTQCHATDLYDTPQHHFHPDATKPGTQCVECHMVETPFMVADPRRDHSLRRPRPDLTLRLGVPNACNVCHQAETETPAWAAQWCETWYASRRGTRVGFAPRDARADDYALALAAGRTLSPDARELLTELLQFSGDDAFRPIVRVSAAILLGRLDATNTATLTDTMPDAAWSKIFSPLVASDDPLLRFAAATASEHREARSRVMLLTPLLSDANRSVRTEAGRVLAAIPTTLLTKEYQQSRHTALGEYFAAQNLVSDQAPSHLNVAVVLEHLDAADAALRRYNISLAIDPNFIPSRVNRAMLHYARGELDAAEADFRAVRQIDPTFGDAAYSLGLLLAEQSRWQDAVAALLDAAKLMPQNSRVRHNLALALDRLIAIEPNNLQWRQIRETLFVQP